MGNPLPTIRSIETHWYIETQHAEEEKNYRQDILQAARKDETGLEKSFFIYSTAGSSSREIQEAAGGKYILAALSIQTAGDRVE